MARSRSNLKRKRSCGSNDSGHCSKHRVNNTDLSKNVSFQSTSSSNTTQQQSLHSVVTYAQIPFHSWMLYFHDRAYTKNSSTALKIIAMIDYFVNNPTISYDSEEGLNFDINSSINNPILLEKWPNFLDDLKANPEQTLKFVKTAFFEVSLNRIMKEAPELFEKTFKMLRLNRINILNFGSINPISCVTWNSHGQLISVSGTVLSIGREKRSFDSVVFVCECGHKLFSKQQKDTILLPSKCDVCGNARMKRVFDSLLEMTKTSQSIEVKLYIAADQSVSEHAFLPNIINVQLTGSLVNNFMPGDRIRIIGIPKVKLGATKASSSNSNPLYIDGQSVFKEDNSSDPNSIDKVNWRVIENIKREPDILSFLVHSLCPSVQGHELIKATLILGLFGGTPTKEEKRDFINIFIIGNLGLGKSQLLRACARVAPQGTYIRGSSTVSLDSKMKTGKESLKENWRFEAGALALSNSALLCLDEFDAMTSQHKIIYKTMKSQRVETMNAELKFSRPFRTSIFAMTDWIKKQYDPSKTILKNVNTNKQLLDQFDLILLMRDNPDAYLGNLMRTRILNEHKKRNPLDQRAGIFNRRDSEPRARTDLTLGERLANSSAHDSSTLLGEHFLGMYINYARIHVKPILSEASKRIITRFCLLRHRIGKDCIKLLINLTEARAKIDLRIETSELDAFDAIEILESSVCIDAKNLAQNHPKSINNTNKITTNKMKLFINDLKAEAFHEKKNIFSEQELRNIAGQENMTGLAFEELLGKLNEQGYLLKVSSKSYKIVFL
ncbi:DNA helicase MCM8-like [Venturia canescens]|uniref:DNA helicase MCM8-like n=1 Tax=Venturia canescens TaxID=32260 RepID=UPI001C9D3BFC|nr:DNA helicase MCM8-like [Venturia canescens]